MYGILFILLIGIDFVFFYPLFERKKPEVDNPKYKEQMKKLFFVNYGLIAAVIGLLIFILTRGNYGA